MRMWECDKPENGEDKEIKEELLADYETVTNTVIQTMKQLLIH